MKNYAKILPLTSKTKMCRCGGMADARDSKSLEGNFMRVRPPPPAPKRRKLKRELSFLLKFVSGENGRKSEGNRVCVRPPRRDSGTASEALLTAERPPPPAPSKNNPNR